MIAEREDFSMNISTLQYFISAAELSSFTKAAKKHFVAQTAISQQMAKLESRLQVKLFEREKNRVELTDAGRVFYEDVKDILNKFEMAASKVKKYAEENKKIITVGYKERYELQLLTKVIHEFQIQNPQTEFVIKEGIGTELIEEVKHGLCDIFANISCTFSEEDKEQLEQYTIYSGSMMLAVSTEHPLAHREYVDARELEGERFIILNVDNLNRGMQDMFEHAQMDGYEVREMEYASNIGAQMLLVELNRGVAFIQDLMVNLQEDRIRFLDIHNSAHKYHVDVVWNRNNKEEQVQKFLGFVKRKLPVERV